MGENAVNNEIWSTQAYILHNEAMREANLRFNEERDRRYKEVNLEKEKALRIKETADLAALNLAREGQQYKDQQADKMRDKTLETNGIYVTHSDFNTAIEKLDTKLDGKLNPLIEFVNNQKGANNGNQITMGRIFSIIAAIGTIAGLLIFLNK